MAFAYRGERYRIGAAWSVDGIKWTRIDDAMGLDRQPQAGTAKWFVTLRFSGIAIGSG